jgi:hypothetical protein
MGRRSLAKRVILTAQNLQKVSIRTGLKLEKRVKAISENIAGPEAVQRMAGCQSGTECLCAKTRDEMIKTHAACLPHKINRFKNEYEEFKQRVSRPAELTIDDVKAWPMIIALGILMFWFGMSVGRWNLTGYVVFILLFIQSLTFFNYSFRYEDY